MQHSHNSVFDPSAFSHEINHLISEFPNSNGDSYHHCASFYPMVNDTGHCGKKRQFKLCSCS